MTPIPDWCREALNTLDFHQNKVNIHGQSEPGNPHLSKNEKKNGWGVRDTARALDISKSKCNDLLILGRALKKDKSLKFHSYNFALQTARRKNK